MDPGAAGRRLASARVARLATVDPAGAPHLVPICFAVAGELETIYSAVDAKPKRTASLRRLANVVANPRVAVLADHYEDADWAALWWVRADGRARVLDGPCAEHDRATALLRERYRQYTQAPLDGPVLAIDVVGVRGWEAARG